MNCLHYLSTMRIVIGDVLGMDHAKLVNGLEDLINSILFSHFRRREVCVAASSIPISMDRFRVQRSNHTEFFGHLMEEEPRHPELISHLDAFTWSYLEFPLKQKQAFKVTLLESYLSRHNLSISSGDLYSAIQARSVMTLDNVSSIDSISSYSAIIGS